MVSIELLVGIIKRLANDRPTDLIPFVFENCLLLVELRPFDQAAIRINNLTKTLLNKQQFKNFN